MEGEGRFRIAVLQTQPYQIGFKCISFEFRQYNNDNDHYYYYCGRIPEPNRAIPHVTNRGKGSIVSSTSSNSSAILTSEELSKLRNTFYEIWQSEWIIFCVEFRVAENFSHQGTKKPWKDSDQHHISSIAHICMLSEVNTHTDISYRNNFMYVERLEKSFWRFWLFEKKENRQTKLSNDKINFLNAVWYNITQCCHYQCCSARSNLLFSILIFLEASTINEFACQFLNDLPSRLYSVVG